MQEVQTERASIDTEQNTKADIRRILALISQRVQTRLRSDSMGGLPERLHSAYTVFLVCGLL